MIYTNSHSGSKKELSISQHAIYEWQRNTTYRPAVHCRADKQPKTVTNTFLCILKSAVHVTCMYFNSGRKKKSTWVLLTVM